MVVVGVLFLGFVFTGVVFGWVGCACGVDGLGGIPMPYLNIIHLIDPGLSRHDRLRWWPNSQQSIATTLPKWR